jgi:hypothetical protein
MRPRAPDESRRAGTGGGACSVRAVDRRDHHLPLHRPVPVPKRTAQALVELFGVPVSSGTGAAITSRAADQLDSFLAQVRQQIAASDVAGSMRPGSGSTAGWPGCTAPAAGPPTGSSPGPGRLPPATGVPRYYVQQQYEAASGVPDAVVRDTATGAVTATVRCPWAGALISGRIAPTGVEAFFVACMRTRESGVRALVVGSRIYRFQVTSTGAIAGYSLVPGGTLPGLSVTGLGIYGPGHLGGQIQMLFDAEEHGMYLHRRRTCWKRAAAGQVLVPTLARSHSRAESGEPAGGCQSTAEHRGSPVLRGSARV